MKAVVSGHARGLGAAIAQELLGRGIPLLGLARHGNAELEARFPGLLEQQEIDLADGAALQRWLAGGALRRFAAGARLLLLVNNAGTVQPIAALGGQDARQIADAISLNVTAPLCLANAAVGLAGELRILHVSSGAARTPYAGWSVYCATKAALDQHARAAALDRVAGVRICSLAPGVIDTAMQAEIRATPAARFPSRARFEDLQRSGQLAAPGQRARQLVDFLLDPQFGQVAVADLRTLTAGLPAR